MYKHILIPLENSSADETILTHIRPLARIAGAKLLLVHVADGWVARNFNQLQLAESEEMKQDRAYLEKRVRELTAEGFSCDAVLALGEPSDEIVKLSGEKCRSHCDDHAWPPLHYRHTLRSDCRQSAPRSGGASAAVESAKLAEWRRNEQMTNRQGISIFARGCLSFELCH